MPDMYTVWPVRNEIERLETVGTAVAQALVKLSVKQEETTGRLRQVWNLHIAGTAWALPLQLLLHRFQCLGPS